MCEKPDSARRIYVIDPAGIVIYSYPPEEKTEHVGSLVHALSLFSREVLKMDLSEVRMGRYYMLIGETGGGIRIAIVSPVREKRLMERIINELNVVFRGVELTPGLVTSEMSNVASNAVRRALEEIPPLAVVSEIYGYASEMPRRAPPRWVERCREAQKKITKEFMDRLDRALRKRHISPLYVKATINRLLSRDYRGAWKSALRSGSKIVVLHTSIVLSHTDPRIDGIFLNKYFDLLEDVDARRYLELYYKSYIDLDYGYDRTLRDIEKLEEKLLGKAEVSDEYLALYLPPSIVRPKRLERLLPIEERLLHDFHMRFIKLRSDAETRSEDLEAWRKFASWCRELYMDLAGKISYRSPTFFLLVANTLESVTMMAESSAKPSIVARSFLEQTLPYIRQAMRSLKHNAWKRISDHTVLAFFSSIVELAALSDDSNLARKTLDIANIARRRILETIAYMILRERLNIIAIGHLLTLQAFAPLIGDEELLSVLFFAHPILSDNDMERLIVERPAFGISIVALLHIATLMYRRHCLGETIEPRMIEIARLCMREVERRVGETEIRMFRWLIRRL